VGVILKLSADEKFILGLLFLLLLFLLFCFIIFFAIDDLRYGFLLAFSLMIPYRVLNGDWIPAFAEMMGMEHFHSLLVPQTIQHLTLASLMPDWVIKLLYRRYYTEIKYGACS
jgi:hypothetical protein